MKNILNFLCLQILAMAPTIGQNVGIGNSKPTIARFEVSGVVGTGKTAALFTSADLTGSPTAISIQRNSPAIGFNQYQDVNSPNGKYTGNGFASLIESEPLFGSLIIKQFLQGVINTQTINDNVAIRILLNGNVGLGNELINDSDLWVSRRPENTNGTALFSGSQNTTHFHYSNKEDTYIRAGLNGGKVVINNFGNINGISPDIGRVQIIGKTSLGTGGSTDPDLALQIHGALAGPKHIYVDASTGSTLLEVNNANIITVTKSINQTYPFVYFSNTGCTDGQLVIVHAAADISLFKAGESGLFIYRNTIGWKRLY
jgi:hypothetical protein